MLLKIHNTFCVWDTINERVINSKGKTVKRHPEKFYEDVWHFRNGTVKNTTPPNDHWRVGTTTGETVKIYLLDMPRHTKIIDMTIEEEFLDIMEKATTYGNLMRNIALSGNYGHWNVCDTMVGKMTNVIYYKNLFDLMDQHWDKVENIQEIYYATLADIRNRNKPRFGKPAPMKLYVNDTL